MAETALDTVARALDLITYIIKHQGVSISELATVFDTTTKEIARELSLLHLCGLPGYSHLELIDLSYEDGESVEVLDPQVLDRPRNLSRSESIAVLLGLDQLAILARDAQTQNEIQALRNRLARNLAHTVDLITIAGDAGTESFLSEITTAVKEHRSLEFDYLSGGVGEPTHKRIAPLAIEKTREHAYLEGIDLQFKARRTYRLDRITSLNLGEKLADERFEFSKGNTPVPVALEKVNPLVKISPARIGRLFAEDHQRIVESNSRDGNYCFIQLAEVGKDWLLRTLISLDGEVRIISEGEFKEEFESMAQRLLNGYDSCTE